MGAILKWTAYDGAGYPVKPIASGEWSLPDDLDWQSIDVKEQYVRYMGGFPADSYHVLIVSQGQSKLLTELGDMVSPQDYRQRKEKENGWKQQVEDRCRERGIQLGRDPRNQ